MHERFNFKTPGELLGKAAELGLDLPFSDDISILLSPLRTGSCTLDNRIVVQPMEGYDSEPDGSPSALTERRYLRYAAGGSGMIWMEAVAVSHDGRSNPGQLWINPGNAEKYRKLNERIRAEAKKAGVTPYLVIQLTHSGRYSKPEGSSVPLAAAPNGILDKTPPHILSDDELLRIQDDYIRAAELSAEAGFDAIDIKACHGYLMIDMLSARSRNGSRYGGESPEARFRYMLEIVERIAGDVPSVMLTTRLNISDVYEGGFGIDKTIRPDYSEGIMLVGELVKRGIRLVNLSMGSPYHNPHVTRPYDTPVPGAKVPAEHPLEGVMRMISGTSAFSQEFPSVMFVGSAYSWFRQFSPNVGAGVLNRGYASLIGFGRNSFAYPDLPLDLARNGKADPAKVCITCSGCTRLIRNLRHGGCVIRDREIYGAELKRLIADGL